MTARPLATYADLLAAPSHTVAELVAGTLVTSARPAAAQAHAAGVLRMDLGSAFQRARCGPRGWWFLHEPELHFEEDVVVPDLAGWRRERMPVPPNVPYFTLEPDWLCEVLSPSTEAFDRTDKLGVYARARVSWFWLVNPIQRTLEILKLAGSRWELYATHKEAERIRAEPFDAIELELNDLWLPGD